MWRLWQIWTACKIYKKKSIKSEILLWILCSCRSNGTQAMSDIGFSQSSAASKKHFKMETIESLFPWAGTCLTKYHLIFSIAALCLWWLLCLGQFSFIHRPTKYMEDMKWNHLLVHILSLNGFNQCWKVIQNYWICFS